MLPKQLQQFQVIRATQLQSRSNAEITKHRVELERLEFEFNFEFQLDFELQFEFCRLLQPSCKQRVSVTVRFISDALEHLVNQVKIKHQS